MRVLDAIDERALDDLMAGGTFFWLDLVAPTSEEIARLGERFAWHPLAVEDAQEFGQRPKLDRYGDHMLLVFYGLAPSAATRGSAPQPLEVHVLVSGAWVVTIRRRASPDLDAVRRQLATDAAPEREQFIVYRILDTLTDTFLPALEAIDEAIDRVEDAILVRVSDEQLHRVFTLKRRLATLRRVVTPQRDLAQRAIDEVADLPGLDAGSRDYLRDVHDHLVRVSDLVDAYRDVLTGAMDVYLSMASNRMNAAMKRLTLVATVFLPVSALTGFFGMNFGWLVRHIESAWSFLVLGVGGALLAAVALLMWAKRERFLGD